MAITYQGITKNIYRLILGALTITLNDQLITENNTYIRRDAPTKYDTLTPQYPTTRNKSRRDETTN